MVTMRSNRVHNFAREILQPLTAGDLLERLPRAFESFAGAGITCRVIDAVAVEHADARLCIPLYADGSIFRVVLVNWSGDALVAQDDETLLAQAAELASLALANRIATDTERERARAEAADVRFDLIGMLAHEMRTPLASIKGYASAMLLDEIDLDRDTELEFLQAIDEESERLNEMVTHLLDSTVIEAGALELHREPVLLAGLIRRTVAVMARRTDRHRLIVSCSSSVPAVYADEQRVQQVLTNLLDNAIKYSPDGGLILVRCERKGSNAIVVVSDQGVGIAPEHLNKLFERFFRTEQRRTLGVSGTGLGLPIVDSIVRAHGGRIWAESVVDEGTKLSFTLPIFQDGEDNGQDVHDE